MESHDKELDDIADQVAESLFGATAGGSQTKPSGKAKKSDKRDLRLLAEWIETNQAKNIVVLTGAGVSTGTGVVRVVWLPEVLLLSDHHILSLPGTASSSNVFPSPGR